MLVPRGLQKSKFITILYAIKARIDSTMWTMIRGKKFVSLIQEKYKFGEEIKMV